MLSNILDVKNFGRNISILLVDIFSFYISLIFAFISRVILSYMAPNVFPEFNHPLEHYSFSYFPLFYFIILTSRGLYIKRNFFWEDVKEFIVASVFYGFILLSFLSISRQILEFSRIVLVLHILYLPLINSCLRYIVVSKIINKIFPINIFYIGKSKDFKNFKKIFLEDAYLGFKISPLAKAEYIFISNKHPKYQDLFFKFQKEKKKVFVLEEKQNFPPMLYKPHLKIGEKFIIIEYENRLLNNINLIFKRYIDYTLAFIILLISIPLMILIAILIKLDSKGPVFYLHERVGKGGKKFKCIKFRTMYIDSEKRLKDLLKDPTKKEEWEKYGKLKEDPRVTRIGKFLRKTSLDELPQIFNVLKGDMSLVGPRPVTEEELNKYYGKFKHYYLSVYPGITGLWQVSGRNKLSYKERVYLDVWYVLNWSIWIDIVILIRTVKEIFKPSGI